jgi:hypothetical protein
MVRSSTQVKDSCPNVRRTAGPSLPLVNYRRVRYQAQRLRRRAGGILPTPALCGASEVGFPPNPGVNRPIVGGRPGRLVCFPPDTVVK